MNKNTHPNLSPKKKKVTFSPYPVTYPNLVQFFFFIILTVAPLHSVYVSAWKRENQTTSNLHIAESFWSS